MRLTITLFITILPILSYSQVYPEERNDRTGVDTNLANHYFFKADSLREAYQYDSSNYYYEKAGKIYLTVAKEIDTAIQKHETETGQIPARPTSNPTELAGGGESEKKDYKINQQITDSKKNESEALWQKHIDCQNWIGWNLAVYQAEFERAIGHIKNTLTLGINRIGKNNVKVGETWYFLGAAYYLSGSYDRALECYQHFLSIMIEALGPTHSNTAEGYNHLGMVYEETGEYDKALEYFKKSLKIILKTLGPKHTNIAHTYNNIGIVYDNKGDYYTALEYYNQALLIWLNNYGNKYPGVAETYNNMGIVYDNLGDYDMALGCYRKSQSIFLETLGTLHPYVAKTYNNIGAVYQNIGELYDDTLAKAYYDKSLECHQKSLHIKLKTFSPNHPSIAMSYLNLGSLFRVKGEMEKAVDYSNRSLKIYLNIFGLNHPLVGHNYNNLGRIFLKKAEHAPTPLNRGEYYTKALQYYQHALQSLVKDFSDNNIYINPNLPDMKEIKEGKGKIYSKLYS